VKIMDANGMIEGGAETNVILLVMNRPRQVSTVDLVPVC
jgi:hypothetical protein